MCVALAWRFLLPRVMHSLALGAHAASACRRRLRGGRSADSVEVAVVRHTPKSKASRSSCLCACRIAFTHTIPTSERRVAPAQARAPGRSKQRSQGRRPGGGCGEPPHPLSGPPAWSLGPSATRCRPGVLGGRRRRPRGQPLAAARGESCRRCHEAGIQLHLSLSAPRWRRDRPSGEAQRGLLPTAPTQIRRCTSRGGGKAVGSGTRGGPWGDRPGRPLLGGVSDTEAWRCPRTAGPGPMRRHRRLFDGGGGEGQAEGLFTRHCVGSASSGRRQPCRSKQVGRNRRRRHAPGLDGGGHGRAQAKRPGSHRRIGCPGRAHTGNGSQ